jgi:hypothetical protein
MKDSIDNPPGRPDAESWHFVLSFLILTPIFSATLFSEKSSHS